MKHPLLSFIFGTGTAVLVAAAIGAPALPARSAAAATTEPGAAMGTTGKVVDTMNSGGYTYVQVDDGTKKIWAAAPEFKVAVGDRVSVPEGMPMRDFYSKTLKRTFELVYFVPEIQVLGGQNAPQPLAPAHGAPAQGAAGFHGTNHNAAAATTVDLSGIRKADGGQTVAELYANKQSLVGKPVAVRGRVVKYTPAVMGKNWLHIQDGSGAAGSNDLTVSTSASAAIGDTVLVHGILGTDKDLGYGYHYDIIIEDASVAVE